MYSFLFNSHKFNALVTTKNSVYGSYSIKLRLFARISIKQTLNYYDETAVVLFIEFMCFFIDFLFQLHILAVGIVCSLKFEVKWYTDKTDTKPIKRIKLKSRRCFGSKFSNPFAENNLKLLNHIET